MAPSFDAIILGLGGIGSAAAFQLASRNSRVIGFDQFSPAHDLGSSHGDSRIIRFAYHENPAYVPLVRRACDLWESLERKSGARILHKTGGLILGRPESPVVAGAIHSGRLHHLPFEVLDARDLRRRFPVLHPRPDDIALYEADAGYLRPEEAIRAHLQCATQCGADLHFREPVTKWTPHASGGGVTVETTAGSYHASKLIFAPGAWTPELLADLAIPFTVQRQVMCWFQPNSGSEHFQPNRFPIYIWDVDGSLVFYGFPCTGDSTEGVKAAIHGGGQQCSAQGIDRSISVLDVEKIKSCLHSFIPALDGKLLRASTCMYTMTPDQHFVVGLQPSYPQVCVAAGFSGHGFKFASVMGEILAQLALTGGTEHDIGFLSPLRFGFE